MATRTSVNPTRPIKSQLLGMVREWDGEPSPHQIDRPGRSIWTLQHLARGRYVRGALYSGGVIYLGDGLLTKNYLVRKICFDRQNCISFLFDLFNCLLFEKKKLFNKIALSLDHGLDHRRARQQVAGRHALLARPRMVDAEGFATGEVRAGAMAVDHRHLAILAIAVAAQRLSIDDSKFNLDLESEDDDRPQWMQAASRFCEGVRRY